MHYYRPLRPAWKNLYREPLMFASATKSQKCLLFLMHIERRSCSVLFASFCIYLYFFKDFLSTVS